MLVRLVGGPYHNRFFDCECSRLENGEPTTVSCTYRLVGFYSAYGSKYWQFVHESLIRRGKIRRECYKEWLAHWELPVRELNDRLKSACERPLLHLP